MKTLLTLAVLALSMAACGGGEEEEQVTGRPSNLNGPCEDGTDCGSGEYCFSEPEEDSICLAVPESCAGDACDCEELDATCGDGGISCFAFGSAVDFACL